MISAKIIADSISPLGNRLTTMELIMPRIILAEFNTHRMFSRNAASSRAIPFEKVVKAVETDPFIPIAWQKHHKGMQGAEYIKSEDAWRPISEWLIARDLAVAGAKALHAAGVTKQLCNRLLEPFMWVKIIVTATDWDNFFKLRKHKDAEIHMQELANNMFEVLTLSTPEELYFGSWHTPYADNLSTSVFEKSLPITTARCARVSYTASNTKKENSLKSDIALHDRLLEAKHMSPIRALRSMRGHKFLYRKFQRMETISKILRITY